MGNKLNKAKRIGRGNREIRPLYLSPLESNSSIEQQAFHNSNEQMVVIKSHCKHQCAIAIDNMKQQTFNCQHDTFEGESSEYGITEFDTTPQTPPTPTLLYPHYETIHNTLSNSNTSLSDFDDLDSNLFHHSIIYLKNSYSSQQYL